MKWTDKDIIEWHKKTFPNCTKKTQEYKVAEELHEMIKAITDDEDDERIKEEVADVYISSLVLAERFNNKCVFGLFFSKKGIQQAIDKKMDENVKRKWVGNHHVE